MDPQHGELANHEHSDHEHSDHEHCDHDHIHHHKHSLHDHVNVVTYYFKGRVDSVIFEEFLKQAAG